MSIPPPGPHPICCAAACAWLAHRPPHPLPTTSMCSRKPPSKPAYRTMRLKSINYIFIYNSAKWNFFSASVILPGKSTPARCLPVLFRPLSIFRQLTCFDRADSPASTKEFTCVSREMRRGGGGNSGKGGWVDKVSTRCGTLFPKTYCGYRFLEGKCRTWTSNSSRPCDTFSRRQFFFDF